MEPTAIYAERQGNLGGETVAMSVDAASMAHVMSILTDLYSDPVLAVIREYSTNAYDSHVEAGVQRPIEVSLPNSMSPFFKVRDFGVGLSVDDIRNVYSKYGASTKRATNEQVGMLGLGCKSALTYTQQFTVRSVKDGQLSFVAISRTESGAGVMQVVQTSESDEENGVEISVPVNRLNDFEHKAREFFRFWEPGTVLVDGDEPQRIEGTSLNDKITLVKGINVDYVVMGNVGYRVSNEHALYSDRSSYRGRNFGIIAKVDIGTVNFTPSREDLHYTEHTLSTLEKVRDQIQIALMDTIQDDINAKPDRASARQSWLEWRQMTGVNLGHMTYKGDAIPAELDVKHLRYRQDYGRGAVAFNHTISFNEIGRYILISGYENGEISTSHRAKMRLWADQNGHAGRSFIVTKSVIEQKWFTSDKAVTWAEVFATKKPRESREGQETYPVSGVGSRYPLNKTLAEIDKTKTLIVWSSGDEGYEDRIGDVMRLYGDGGLAIRLAKNRWDKFLRENAKAVKVQDVIRQMMKDAFDALSDDEKLSMSIDYNDRASLHRLNADRLDDPELARYTRVVHSITKTDAIDRFNEVMNVCSRLGFHRLSVDKVDSPRVKYPLLAAIDHYSGLAIEHFYLYANTLYSKENN